MKKTKLKQGLVQVYTGNGKGKTTAAAGLAVRAAGQGLRVCFLQFLKSSFSSDPRGEISSLRKLGIRCFKFHGNLPCSNRCLTRQEKAELRKCIQQAFFRTREIISNGCYDIVIMDEINFVLHKRLLKVTDVLNLIKNKPQLLELILTGRHAPKSIIRTADLVTEMREEKHPLRQGIVARKGIEY